MYNNTKLLSIAILLLIGHAGQAQIQQKLDEISQELETVMQAKNIPSVSIGIVYKGERYFINRGTMSRQKAKLVDENSMYQIASLGKTFVGLVIHQLLLDNKLRLDQPLTDFLDSEFSESRWEKLSKITVEHLLHHRSGLPQDARASYRRKDGEPFEYDYTEKNLYTEFKKLRIRPGNRYQYSNIGYATLAFIAEKASGKPYDQLLKEVVTEPIKIENTTLTPNQNQLTQVVTPYRKDKRDVETKPWHMGKLAPPSALYSTTADLTAMLDTQLTSYKKYADNQKIDKWILTHNTKLKNAKTISAYGYGFVSWGYDTYGHAGDMDGYASNYSFNPVADFGVVLLTSSGENWIPPLVGKINAILAK